MVIPFWQRGRRFAMRGEERGSEELFSYVRLERRIPKDHPLRAIRALVDEALAALSGRFAELYSHTGRPSIAPEYLLRATLLQAFFTVRSERQLMEQIDYNLLFRWFVGLSIDDAVWDASTFSKNRDRLLEADLAREFLATLLSLPRVKRLLSNDHFSVDGTLLKAWAGMKSFRPKDGSGNRANNGRNGERNFRREKRSNKTHVSGTDPDAKLYRKGDGHESRLCYMGHVLMENRNGLAVKGDVTRAGGTAERATALDLIDSHRPSRRRITVGGDKGYDVEGFVHELRERGVTPHIAIDGHLTKTGKRRRTAIDGRALRHPGYAISQCCRKRIEEVFGWIKTTGGLAQLKVRGLAKVQAVFTFAILAYNLVRIPKLLVAT
jgi:transposase